MIHSLLIAVLLSLSMVVSAVDTQITIAGSTTVFPAVDADRQPA
jgi:ABC-type phosphate transport system substrate-binding protein